MLGILLIVGSGIAIVAILAAPLGVIFAITEKKLTFPMVCWTYNIVTLIVLRGFSQDAFDVAAAISLLLVVVAGALGLLYILCNHFSEDGEDKSDETASQRKTLPCDESHPNVTM